MYNAKFLSIWWLRTLWTTCLMTSKPPHHILVILKSLCWKYLFVENWFMSEINSRYCISIQSGIQYILEKQPISWYYLEERNYIIVSETSGMCLTRAWKRWVACLNLSDFIFRNFGPQIARHPRTYFEQTRWYFGHNSEGASTHVTKFLLIYQIYIYEFLNVVIEEHILFR